MPNLKTQPTKAAVNGLINSMGNEELSLESHQLLALMERATNARAKRASFSVREAEHTLDRVHRRFRSPSAHLQRTPLVQWQRRPDHKGCMAKSS